MIKDKFSAVWLSHSSIGDYLKCPRAYYLRNVYKDPKTRHKVNIIKPALALGQAVHEVIESLSILPVDIRLKTPLLSRFNKSWEKVTGKKGGFRSKSEEEEYKQRGIAMIKNVADSPGPLLTKAVKIAKGDLPYFWLSDEDNLILCGKIDWLEYLPETDSLHIIDFKTGRGTEDSDSLQLPIYYLLANNCQKRKVEKISYWYLARDKHLTNVKLPDISEAKKKLLEIGKKISLARKLDHMECKHKTGCMHCLPFEEILKGKAEFVGTGSYNQDLYII